MPAPVQPIYNRLPAGNVREQILGAFRDSLRELIDPATGAPFTEDVIRLATMQGGRFWVEAEAIDLLSQGMERRAEFLATQVDPRRASTAFLEHFHGPQAKLPRLEATGGAGQVRADAIEGTTYIGSTLIPDALATQAHDKAGLRYQVFAGATVTSSGETLLTLQAVDTGRATNLTAGTELTWINPPPGSNPKCTVTVGGEFAGGTPRETDQEWGERLFDARGSKPASGNPAHFRLWARSASNAVADAFVYACALNAGSVVVAIVQKRAGVRGPTARVPTLGTMSVVRGRLTPPASPIVPARVHVVVVPAVPETVDAVVLLEMRRGSAAGWADASPWPTYGNAAATITAVQNQRLFRMSASSAPLSASPQLMVWDAARSAFERLSVRTVAAEADEYLVELVSPPIHTTLAAGQRISPYSSRHAALAGTVEAYFDSLGPGEVVSLTDPRALRAYRRPRPETAAPYAVGPALLTYISDALGGALPATLAETSRTTPSIPATASAGPRLLVAGRFAVYPGSG